MLFKEMRHRLTDGLAMTMRGDESVAWATSIGNDDDVVTAKQMAQVIVRLKSANAAVLSNGLQYVVDRAEAMFKEPLFAMERAVSREDWADFIRNYEDRIAIGMQVPVDMIRGRDKTNIDVMEESLAEDS